MVKDDGDDQGQEERYDVLSCAMQYEINVKEHLSCSN